MGWQLLRKLTTVISTGWGAHTGSGGGAGEEVGRRLPLMQSRRNRRDGAAGGMSLPGFPRETENTGANKGAGGRSDPAARSSFRQE